MTHRSLAVVIVLLSACGSPGMVGTQPSWRQGSGSASPAIAVAPVTFSPSQPAAIRYNEPVQAPPHSPLGDAVIVALHDAALHARLPDPIADARLFRACTELAEVVPENGVIGYGAVEFALQRNGIIEPSPHLLVVWGELDTPGPIIDQLRPRLAEVLGDGANARVGIGSARRKPDGTGAVVFAVQTSGIATSPIPRTLPAGGSVQIDGVVDARYHTPEVFVTHDDGSTEALAIAAGRSGGIGISLACGAHRGRQQVEITASDAAGSTVLANFPVWCGTDPPPTFTITPTRDDEGDMPPDAAAQRLFELLNRDRVTAGLQALVWDDRVAAVARAHSEEMQRTKIVAHISPTTGAASDRVRAAGIRTAVVLENVARAYGVGEAHAGLMNSPGHRANMMSATATHIGIGVVLGDEVGGRRELFLTQVFIRIPPLVDRAHATDLVAQRVSAARKVVVTQQLSVIAQQIADGLAAGKTRDELWPAARTKLDTIGVPYVRVGSAITAVADLAAVDGKELIGGYAPDDVGVGVAQGPHPEIGDNAIWIVVVMAERQKNK
jgi:uncharacterized protein YkwD